MMTNEQANNIIESDISGLCKLKKSLDEDSVKMITSQLKINIFPSSMKNLSLSVYRTRLKSSFNKAEELNETKSFSYVPKSICTEYFPRRGRLNLPGQSIFYSSLDPFTNLKEIKVDFKGNEIIYISKWHIDKGEKIKFINIPHPSNIDVTLSKEKSDTKFIINNPKIVDSPFGEFLKLFGGLLCDDETGKEPDKRYLITSLLANKCFSMKGKIKNMNNMEIKCNAIIYPSIEDAGNSQNIAFTPDFIDRYARLEYVLQAIVKNDKSEINFEKIGIANDGKIVWNDIMIYDENVKYTECFIELATEEKLEVSSDARLFLNKEEMRLKNIIPFEKIKKNIAEKMNAENMLEEIEKERIAILCWQQEGVEIETSCGLREVEKIYLKIEYRYTLEPIFDN